VAGPDAKPLVGSPADRRVSWLAGGGRPGAEALVGSAG
jgi:hypothetical protein